MREADVPATDDGAPRDTRRTLVSKLLLLKGPRRKVLLALRWHSSTGFGRWRALLMPRHTTAGETGSRQFAVAALWVVAMTLVSGCASEEPTSPAGSYSLSGRVRLTGYLVDASGRFAGTRLADDADGVDVELRLNQNTSRHAITVDGVYRFDGLAPGGYTVRAQVIGEVVDETNDLTIVNGDLVSGDTLQLVSFGDILPIPNPAPGYIDLFFSLPDTQQVDVRVRDMRGTTKQVIVSKVMSPGLQQVYWNGRDGAGTLVHDALYWVTLESGNDTRAQLLFRQ
jgi:hypothetical protein